MTGTESFLDSPLDYQLGWTLVHFLWQGTLVGVAYALLRRPAAGHSPQRRYLLGLVALASLAAMPVVTFLHLHHAAVAAAGNSDAMATLVRTRISLLGGLRDWLRPLVPWTVPAWFAGVTLCGARYLFGWLKARRLMRHATRPAPLVWQQSLRRLALTLGVKIQVQLTLSARVTVPCVVGWLRPVILLPPAILTGLTPLQLEMLLAHELAHVRRYDYVVNLLQAAVETLLFYHPVVRWISNEVRRERELCCDDMAIRACGDALNYVHALADLAALHHNAGGIAMAANGGDLSLRVERLLVDRHAAVSTQRFSGSVFLTALCMCSLLMMSYMRPVTSALPLLRALNIKHLPVTAQPAPPAEALPTASGSLTISRTDVRLQRRIPEARHPVTPTTAVLDTVDLIAPAAPVPPSAAPEVATTPPSPPDPLASGLPLTSVFPDPNGSPAIPDPRAATAELRIISMSHLVSDPVPQKTPHHVYCQPLTGSRVCR